MAPSTLPDDKIAIGMEPVDLTPITQTTTVVPKLMMAPELRFAGEKSPDVKVIIEVEKKEVQGG